MANGGCGTNDNRIAWVQQLDVAMGPTAVFDSILALLPIALFLDIAVVRLRATARPVSLTQWVVVIAVNVMLIALVARD